MLAVSGLAVAFVSAIAAAAAAIMAPISAWLIAREGHKHERWTKTYEDRRAAYIAMLRTVYVGRQLAHATARSIEHNDPTIIAREGGAGYRAIDQQLDEIALVLAMSTDAIQSAWSAYNRAEERTTDFMSNAPRDTEAERAASAKRIRDDLEQNRILLNNLRAAVSADLRE